MSILKRDRSVSRTQMNTLSVKRLGGGTLYKLLLIGMLSLHVVITLTVAVLVLLGVLPVEADEPPLAMTLAFMGGYLAVGIVTAPIWVGALWLGIWPGLLIYSFVRPMRLRYHTVHGGG